MKSKTLSADRIWDCFKRQIWIFAIIFLSMLFGYIVHVIQRFDNWENLSKLTNTQMMVQYMGFIRSDLALTGFVILVMGALLNGIAGFWYLHSAKMSDFYHCLPIRREKLYWNQAAAGVLSYLAPEVAVSLLLLCVGAAKGFFTMELVGQLAVTVGLHILCYLLVYATTVLAMLLTGRALVGVMGALAFLSYVPMLLLLLAYYGNIFFTTFAWENLWKNEAFWLSFCGSPAAWFLLVENRRMEHESLFLLVAVGILAAAALFLLGRWVYKKRPSEAAGSAMAFAGFGRVVKFLVEIPAALGVGILGYRMAPANSRGLWWVLGVLIGLVLVHGVMEIIYQADFRKFFTHRLELGAEALLAAILASLFLLDPFGYDSYLPAQEKLASIAIASGALSNETKVSFRKDKEGNLGIDYGANALQEQMKLPADGKVYELLQYICQNRTRFSWRDEAGMDTPNVAVNLAYRLKNGRTVWREYRLPMTEETREELVKLWQWQEFREGFYCQLEEKSMYVRAVNWESMGDQVNIYEENDPARFEVLEALRQDLAEAPADSFQEMPVGKLTMDYGIQDKGEQNLVYLGSEEFYIYSSYKRTIALLKERGATPAVHPDPQKTTEIKVYDYRGERHDGGLDAEMVFTDRKEIETLSEAVVNGNCWSFQLPPTEENISLSIETVDHYGSPTTVYGQFLYVPELIEERKSEKQ